MGLAIVFDFAADKRGWTQMQSHTQLNKSYPGNQSAFIRGSILLIN